MSADDPSTTTAEGVYNGKFWFTPGGQIEEGEDLKTTALRELFEETGLLASDVSLGPIVWKGSFELILSGKHQILSQQFITIDTEKTEIDSSNFTDAEKSVIKELRWFSLEQIKNCPERIYPTRLAEYLEPILKGDYPLETKEVDLN